MNCSATGEKLRIGEYFQHGTRWLLRLDTRSVSHFRGRIIPPRGNDRRPAIIFLHGGVQPMPLDTLKKDVSSQATQCRFLAAGYIIVAATSRSRAEDPQTRDALVDCLAVIDYVKKLPRVDPKSVVNFAGSGGGSLALELAGETELCAVAAGEPANILFTGMLTKDTIKHRGGDLMNDLMENSRKYYTPELQKFTEDKIKKISCPVFITHSDVHLINRINNEIVIPTMRALGKPYEVMFIPGQQHGFYNGYVHPAGTQVYGALACFYSRHLVTKPNAVDRSLIKLDPVGDPGTQAERDPSAKANRAALREQAKKAKESGQAPVKD